MSVAQVDMRVTISYIHEGFTQSVPFLTGLFDDVNHQPRGFLSDSGQVDQFDKNIRDEWFKTDSTARGSTRTSNDYMIGVQTGSSGHARFVQDVGEPGRVLADSGHLFVPRYGPSARGWS